MEEDNINWKHEYNKLFDKLNYEMEKHHNEAEALQGELKRCRGELEKTERLLNVYIAKIEMVELIFGRGSNF